MGDELSKLGLDISNFEASIKKGIESLERLEKSAGKTDKSIKNIEKSAGIASKALSGLTKIAGALGVSLSVGALVAFGKSLMGFGKETVEASRMSDMSTDSFQRMKAELSNFVSADDASQAIGTLSKTLRDARDGSIEAQDKLQSLGISMDEILDPATDAKSLFEELATNYQEAGDKTEFLQRASALFGDDLARKLVPALEVGGAALKSFGESVDVAKDSTLKLGQEGALYLEQFGKDVKTFSLRAVGYLMQFVDKMKSAYYSWKHFGKMEMPDLTDSEQAQIDKNNKRFTDAENSSGATQGSNAPATGAPGSKPDGKPSDKSGNASGKAFSMRFGIGGRTGKTPKEKNQHVSPEEQKRANRDIADSVAALADAESKRSLSLDHELKALEAQERVLQNQYSLAVAAGKLNEAQAIRAKQNAVAIQKLEIDARRHDMTPEEKREANAAQRKHERSLRAAARREMQRQNGGMDMGDHANEMLGGIGRKTGADMSARTTGSYDTTTKRPSETLANALEKLQKMSVTSLEVKTISNGS